MSSLNEIFSDRLKRARIMRNLSMDALCEKIGNAVSKQAISKYEKGESLPGSHILILLSQALGVKPDYFFREPQFAISNIEFRKKAKMGTKEVEAIKEEIRDIIERYLEIEEVWDYVPSFSNPVKGMPVASDKDTYEVVKELKNAWNIGEDGILSVTDLLESKNIKVVEITADASFDGLSGYVNNDENMPFVVVNKSFDVERLRFTALHELGHLVMSLPEEMEKKEKERLCHLFASEMLISRDTFIEVLGERRNDISLRELKVLQSVYGISVDALMFKAKALGVISESKHTSFCIRKNKSIAFKKAVEGTSYKGTEESSRFDRLVYRALASDMISCSKAAALLNEPMEDVKSKLELV